MKTVIDDFSTISASELFNFSTTVTFRPTQQFGSTIIWYLDIHENIGLFDGLKNREYPIIYVMAYNIENSNM